MSKKNYEAIAAILAKIRMTMPTDDWVRLMLDFIDIFEEDNPRFDKAKFKEACYR